MKAAFVKGGGGLGDRDISTTYSISIPRVDFGMGQNDSRVIFLLLLLLFAFQLLHAPPLGMSPGEIEKLRSACEIQAKKADSEMKDFLARLEMSSYEAALEAYGVARLGDLIDPRIVSDEDLVGPDLGFSSEDAKRFRTAAQHAEKKRAQQAASSPGATSGEGQLVQRLTGFNGGDDDMDDGASAFHGFSSMKNDVVVAAHAQLGKIKML